MAPGRIALVLEHIFRTRFGDQENHGQQMVGSGLKLVRPRFDLLSNVLGGGLGKVGDLAYGSVDVGVGWV